MSETVEAARDRALLRLPQSLQFLYKAIGYRPEPEQAEVLLSSKRRIAVTGGERAGKSLVASKYLLRRHLEDGQAGSLYWLVAADYERTRQEFEYLTQDFMKLDLVSDVTKRIDPGCIQLKDGTRIETKSGKDPRTLAMKAPQGIIGCEASQLDLETYRKLDLRTAEKRGWLFLSGTLEGSLGWYPSLCSSWAGGYGDSQSFTLPTWTNRTVFPGGRDDPEIKRLEAESSEAWFLERLAGRPCPPRGLVLPEFRADMHIKPLTWLGESEVVYLWEDPGYGTSSAHALEVAQITKAGQVQVFDEIYQQGLLTSEIIWMAKGKPWWKSPKVLVSDPHYKDQHHAMTSVAEEWLRETGLVAGGERGHILPGIETFKRFLRAHPVTHEPSLVIDPSCHGLLSELGAEPHPLQGPRFGQTCVYHWKVDREGNTVGEVPEDEFNHAIKAVTYGLVARFGHGQAESDKATVTYFGHQRRGTGVRQVVGTEVRA